jgi:molybdenum cofactor cytidylyltransferase
VTEELWPETAAIVLAAGRSSRLGQPKQLLQIGGSTLLRRTVELALATGAVPVCVVLDAGDGANGVLTACRQTLDGLAVTIVENSQAVEGMGSSLRVGMAAIARLAPQAERVLLLVCDQPQVRLEQVLSLMQSSGLVAAAGYSGRIGVPAVFSRRYFPALHAAVGDQGARTLLRVLPVTVVPMPEAAFDIDTSEDVAALRALEK